MGGGDQPLAMLVETGEQGHGRENDFWHFQRQHHDPDHTHDHDHGRRDHHLPDCQTQGERQPFFSRDLYHVAFSGGLIQKRPPHHLQARPTRPRQEQ